MGDRKYVDYPRVAVELSGKVTGTLELAVTDGGHVHVSDVRNAYSLRELGVESVTPVTVQGSTYSVGVHLYWHGDKWSTERPDGERSHVHLSRDGKTYGNDAPPKTHGAALMAAFVTAVTDNVTDRMRANAEYSAAYNDESRAIGKMKEAREAYDEALREAASAKVRRTMAEKELS